MKFIICNLVFCPGIEPVGMGDVGGLDALHACEPARLAASTPQIWQATEAATALLRF